MKIILVIFSFFLAACEDPKDLNKSENYKYSYESNGCKAGEKSFSSKEDYCDGLKNNESNNFCAKGLRYDKFQAESPGKNW